MSEIELSNACLMLGAFMAGAEDVNSVNSEDSGDVCEIYIDDLVSEMTDDSDDSEFDSEFDSDFTDDMDELAEFADFMDDGKTPEWYTEPMDTWCIPIMPGSGPRGIIYLSDILERVMMD